MQFRVKIRRSRLQYTGDNHYTSKTTDTVFSIARSNGSLMLSSQVNPKLLKISSWILLATWALIQMWNARFFEHFGDGISYLDMAQLFSEANWHDGFSSSWNILYPLLIAVFLKILRPDTAHAFLILKIINFAIFIATIPAFDCFLAAFIRFYERQTLSNCIRVPRAVWYGLGYCLFADVFLCLSGISTDTPDLLAACLTFLAMRNCLNILSGLTDTKEFIGFGFFTGLAYIAKSSSLMPLLWCLPFLLKSKSCEGFWKKSGLALVAMSMFVLPYITYLASRTGEISLSATAKSNYLWFVQEGVSGIELLGVESLRKSLKHPVSQLYSKPDVFEFGKTLPGTYPYWFDSAYWLQGAKLIFKPQPLAIVVFCNILHYCSLFLAAYCSVFLAVTLVFGAKPITVQSMKENAVVSGPAVLTFLSYALVINLLCVYAPFTNRYFSTALIFLVLSSFASLRLADNARGRRALKTGIILTYLLVGSVIAQQLYGDIKSSITPTDFVHYRVAEKLIDCGAHAGDNFAWIGANEPLVDWAYLARVRLIAEIPRSEEFFAISSDKRADILNKLRNAGVKYVIYFPHAVSSQVRPVLNFTKAGLPERLRLQPLKQVPLTNGATPPANEHWNHFDQPEFWLKQLD